MSADMWVGVMLGGLWGAAAALALAMTLAFFTPSEKTLRKYRDVCTALLATTKQANESTSHWLGEYCKMADAFAGLEKDSKEAREFWMWARKYRRGEITQYRLVQRAKKRLGVE